MRLLIALLPAIAALVLGCAGAGRVAASEEVVIDDGDDGADGGDGADGADRADRGNDRACASCHAAEAAGHAASRHAVAATNAEFRASFARSPDQRWCLSCHAPDGVEDGVGCTSCHRGAHKDRVDDVVCAGCHQLGLPPSLLLRGANPGTLAQATIDEHRAVRAASPATPPCVRCHTDGHRFRGGHDKAFAARAVAVDTERVEGGRLRFTLRAEHVGHAVPTGDPFRALVLRTCADAPVDDACAVVVDTRRFLRRIEGKDTRPWPGKPITVDVDGAGVVGWTLSLESTEPALAGLPGTALQSATLP